MYESLKEWATFKCTRLPFDKRDTMGTKIYKEPVEIECYPSAKERIVKSADGKEHVSYTTLYIDATLYDVSTLDAFIFEGKQQDVLQKKTFYDGNTKVADIHEVYL